jgi:hypothetical protein
MFRSAGLFNLAAALSAVVLGAATETTWAAVVPVTEVASSGGQAAGTGGGTFRFVDMAAINNAGQVAFRGHLSEPAGGVALPSGVWAGVPGALRLVALTGDTPQGTTEPLREVLGVLPRLNERGDVFFSASLGSASSPRHGAFFAEAGQSGAVRPLALSGTSMPGLGAGVTAVGFHEPPRLHPAAAAGTVVGLLSGPGVVPANDSAAWTGPVGDLRLVARAGDPAPGAPGARFAGQTDSQGVAFRGATVDRQGNTVFHAHLAGPGINPAFDAGLWVAPAGGAPVLVARSGDPAPGLGGSARYGHIGPFQSVSNGRVVFAAPVTGAGPGVTTVLFAGDPGGVDVILKAGDAAPGTDTTFAGIGGAVMNDAGQLAFWAPLASGGPLNDGVFAGAPEDLRLVARSGELAPDVGPDVRFNLLSTPAINGRGQVAFGGSIRGAGVSGVNDDAIWATDPAGELRLVVREGDLLDTGEGAPRRVRNLIFFSPSNGGEDGAFSGFNDAGQLVFLTYFDDESHGVYIATVPEPVGAALLAAFAARAVLRRARRR